MITGIDGGDGLGAGCWDDAVAAQAVAQACSPGFEAWWSRVAGSGFCARQVDGPSCPLAACSLEEFLSDVDPFSRSRRVDRRESNVDLTVLGPSSGSASAPTAELVFWHDPHFLRGGHRFWGHHGLRGHDHMRDHDDMRHHQHVGPQKAIAIA